jgi:RNA polymerase sigma factor (sigma-70 family)
MRQQMIEEHMPLAKSLARGYSHPNYSKDDLISEAYVALVRGVDKALEKVTDGNYSQYLNTSICNQLKNIVTRSKQTSQVSQDLLDERNTITNRRPAFSPAAKLKYQELLEKLELSDREITILGFKLRGYSNVEIARALRTHTIEVHRTLKDIGAKYKQQC